MKTQNNKIFILLNISYLKYLIRKDINCINTIKKMIDILVQIQTIFIFTYSIVNRLTIELLINQLYTN